MPNTNYSIRIEQTADGVAAIVSRNSTTNIVDATSGAPNRVEIPYFTDNAKGNKELVVTAATAATPIVATVPAGHGLQTGDVVRVRKGTGDPGINGTFFVSVSGNDVTLIGSASAGTYMANSARLTKLEKAPSFHIALAAAMKAVLNDKARIESA
jgi:hypothetical protein